MKLLRPLIIFTAVISVITSSTPQTGMYFSKESTVLPAVPVFEESRTLLPIPVLENNPVWIDMYWKCWEIAFRGIRSPSPGSPFVSNWLDEAFSENIFQWDTIFMMMFARYAHSVFPAIESLDNFYCLQRESGFIAREYREADGEIIHFDFDGGLFSEHGWKNTINPPLFSWAEVESYRLTGDKSRFGMILPVLEKYAEWLNRSGDPEALDWEAQGRKSVTAVHQLFWNTPLGSGMDNTPRPADKGAGWVEMSSQMVLMYKSLAMICDELGFSDKARRYRDEAGRIANRINQWCWNEEDGFYYDVRADGTQFKKKTIGGFWPLLAEVPNSRQAERMAAHLTNESEFWRKMVFPTLSADEPEYHPGGGYWLGSVWAPTNVMVIKGLEKYGYHDLAAAAADNYLHGMAHVFELTNTVYENYAPDSFEPGDPALADFVGWSGCGPIQLLIENVIGLQPDAADRTLAWHLRRTDRHGIQQLQLGQNRISVICAARSTPESPADIHVECQHPFTLIVIHPSGTRPYHFESGSHQVTVDW